LVSQAESTELNDSIKHFQFALRKARGGDVLLMQAAQDYASVKAHLEEKVAGLKREREAAMREVESLGLRVAIKDLERQAKALEDELGALNGKRSALEQKLASFNAPAAQAVQPQQRQAVVPASAH
jgi:hypothetical protein